VVGAHHRQGPRAAAAHPARRSEHHAAPRRPGPHASLILRWTGGAIRELTVPLRRRQPKIRTSQDVISLIRRFAVHLPRAQIAGILNRQHRTTARGLSFTASRVASLRTHRHIPCHKPGRP